MGCGASKTQEQQPSRQKSRTLSVESTSESQKQSKLEHQSRSTNASPHSSSNQNRRPSTLEQAEHDQALSEHRRLSNQTNNSDGLGRRETRTPNDELNNNTIEKRDRHSSSSSSSSLSTDNPVNGTKLRSRTQSLRADSLQANDMHRKDSRSVSKLSRNLDGKPSATSPQHTGSCQYCSHCRKVKNGKMPPIPELKWITKNPGVDEFVIKMDNYDADAIRKKLISEHGHLPGCYDYRPYLTIEPANDNDDGKENDYYTQPFVARKTSIILPLHTPFPEYNMMQRQEQRLNKPHEPTLFVD